MSLYQQLLAALSGTPTQNERLIRLRTPLGAEVLLAERVSLQEHIGPGTQTQAGFRAEVIALAADTHIELKRLIGQPALIELELADGSTRPWHGHITGFALIGSDGGLARYRLIIEPWLAFLSARQDSWVFQDASVIDVIEELFADYQAQGKLAPAWRFELADAAVYPQRSLCIQYQESDLDFINRLLLEEGLFCWWEHEAAEGDNLGRHTLVIADHNGAIKANAQPRVRYTQSAASLAEDSLTRWRTQAAVHTARLEQASQDYRSNGGAVALRAQSQSGLQVPDSLSALTLTDVPGLYAYEDSAQGERLALRQMQALDARRHQARAAGTLRSAAPATRITLAEHPLHKFGSADDEFIILGVHHKARSNLRADHKAQVLSLLGAIAQDQQDAPASPNSTEEPVYSSTLTLQPAALPVRMAALDEQGRPDVRLHPRPTVHGVQTAIVVGTGVGTGAPVHTDRDHRIKVQFHWQRGANSSHRINHTSSQGQGSNAPASDASGTWVRVAEAWAGANWGANFTPRVGQEVLVGFIGGDIDRPVVTGSVYNGQGQQNAQSNQAAAGAAGATGNAAAWFPGDQAAGPHQGHQHSAVLAGHKSQELSASQSGTGGFNQLVFDDSAGTPRIELSSTSAQSRLQLGHLLHQSDNQRLQARGHGVDLSTQAWGAVRAGSGLLISAHARAGGSLAATQQIDAREPQAQLDQGRELIHTLAESAQQHKAKLQGEPDVIGAKKAQTNKQLSVEQGLWASEDSLLGKDTRGDANQDGTGIGGGTGTAAAWTRPDLVIAAPAGIASQTPANAIYSAGHTASLSAGQDIQHTVQANHATVAKDGLILYTYGKASNTSKPNQETGIALHAASGNVNLQSQQGATKITADKSVNVASTQDMVRITAPQHVLLTAAGAALELKGGNITLKGPGKVEFKASMKELKGPATAQQSLELKKPGALKLCEFKLRAAADGGVAAVPI
jgi:type VI secretion system secreted protein VgrG